MALAAWSSLKSWFHVSYPGRSRGRHLRLEALEDRTVLSPGDLDPTFGSGGLVISDFPGFANATAGDVAVQPDGRVIVVGSAYTGNGGRFALTRFNPDGSPDDSFGDGGRVSTAFPGWGGAGAARVVIQPDGRIVLAGAAGNSGGKFPGPGVFAVARYNSDGSLDSSFGTGGLVTTAFPGEYRGYVSGLALLPDGGIVVSGEVFNSQSPYRPDLGVARYNSDGSLDRSFGAGGLVDTTISGLAQGNCRVAVGDGHVVVVGNEGFLDTARLVLIRYNDDGSLDPGFGTGGVVATAFPGFDGAVGSSVAVLANGRILAAGAAFHVSSHDGQFALARYDSDGSLDPTFGTGGFVTTAFDQFRADADAMTLQRDGRIVLAGSVFSDTIGTQLALARYDSDGTLDESFGADGRVITPFPGYSRADAFGMAVQPDGRIVATGSIYSGCCSNIPHIGVARYLGDASTATHILVSAPAAVAAGEPFGVTVTALDEHGDVVPDYAGTVTLTSTDPRAPILGRHTFTIADGGAFTFSGVQLFTAGPQSLFADDGYLTGQADLTVDPGLAVALVLTGPDHATAGQAFVVTLTAYDAYGNVATGYRGSVSFVSTDPAATLPVDQRFSADDAGSHDFTITLDSPGPVRLTAIDTFALTLGYLDLTVT